MFHPTAMRDADAADAISSGVRPESLENDDRDLALRLRLILVVVRPDLVHLLPEPVALLALRGARVRAELVALDLHADLRRLGEVAIPVRMLGRSALRRDDHDVVAVLAEDERRRALLAGLAAGRR